MEVAAIFYGLSCEEMKTIPISLAKVPTLGQFVVNRHD